MSKITMEELVNYCKQYGFIFQGSEIYNGLSNTWDYGSLGCDTTYKGNYAPVNNLDSQNHLKIYDKLYIPASVLNINESTITYINLQPWIIEIAEDNPIYKAEITETSGKTKYSIVKK